MREFYKSLDRPCIKINHNINKVNEQPDAEDS